MRWWRNLLAAALVAIASVSFVIPALSCTRGYSSEIGDLVASWTAKFGPPAGSILQNGKLLSANDDGCGRASVMRFSVRGRVTSAGSCGRMRSRRGASVVGAKREAVASASSCKVGSALEVTPSFHLRFRRDAHLLRAICSSRWFSGGASGTSWCAPRHTARPPWACRFPMRSRTNGSRQLRTGHTHVPDDRPAVQTR